MKNRNIHEDLLKRAATAAALEVRKDTLTRLARWVEFLEQSPNAVLFPMEAKDVRALIKAYRDGREGDIIDKARGIYRPEKPKEPEAGFCPCGCGFKTVMCAHCDDKNLFTRTSGKSYPLPGGCPTHPEGTRHQVGTQTGRAKASDPNPPNVPPQKTD